MSLGLCVDTSLLGARMLLLDTEKKCQILWKFASLDRQTTMIKPLSSLTDFLDSSCYSLNKVTGILVGIGPGSFTGIKIGLSFSYGFSETPEERRLARGISLFEEFANYYLVDRPKTYTSVLLPNTKKSAYIAYLEQDKIVMKSCAFDCPSDLLQTCLRRPVVLGDPVDQTYYGGDATYISMDEVNRLGLSLLHKNFETNWSQGFSHEICEPIYLRKSSPEEKLLANG